MTKQEEIRVLTRQAFRDLLQSIHRHPMERESDLVEVEVAGYLRCLNLKGVVIKSEYTCGQCIRGFTDSVHSGNSSVCPACHGNYKTVVYEPLIGGV